MNVDIVAKEAHVILDDGRQMRVEIVAGMLMNAVWFPSAIPIDLPYKEQKRIDDAIRIAIRKHKWSKEKPA